MDVAYPPLLLIIFICWDFRGYIFYFGLNGCFVAMFVLVKIRSN